MHKGDGFESSFVAAINEDRGKGNSLACVKGRCTFGFRHIR